MLVDGLSHLPWRAVPGLRGVCAGAISLSHAGIVWTRHAIAELANESWGRRTIENGLVTSQVIEDYPALHRPLPDCLILGQLASGDPFHAVLAIDIQTDVLVIVTVYRPSLEEWDDDWKTRKR